MEGRPFKFRILEILEDGGPCWNCDLVRKLQEEYHMPSNYQRDCLNFDVIEVAASGMVMEMEAKLDEDGSFKEGSLLVKYKISPIGHDLLEELKAKAHHRKGE